MPTSASCRLGYLITQSASKTFHDSLVFTSKVIQSDCLVDSLFALRLTSGLFENVFSKVGRVCVKLEELEITFDDTGL